MATDTTEKIRTRISRKKTEKEKLRVTGYEWHADLADSADLNSKIIINHNNQRHQRSILLFIQPFGTLTSLRDAKPCQCGVIVSKARNAPAMPP